MFGPVGFWELLFIFLIALIIFGPRKLPELGKFLGRGLSEFKKASDDFKNSLQKEISEENGGEEKPSVEEDEEAPE